MENWEITEPLIVEYNLKVRNLLLEIQTDYSFRLCCHDMKYNDMAVWTISTQDFSKKKFNTTGATNKP